MNKQVEDIKTIREMMEKSSKFQALNGLSIAIAGVIALIGAGFTYFYMKQNYWAGNYGKSAQEVIQRHNDQIKFLFIVALVILVLAVAVITLFT